MTLYDLRTWHKNMADGYAKGIDALESSVQEKCRRAIDFHRTAAMLCESGGHRDKLWQCVECGGCQCAEDDSGQKWCDDCGASDITEIDWT